MRKFFKYQLPPILWIVVIYILSSLPNLHLKIKTLPGTDTVAHAFIYFVLSWLTRRAFYNQDGLPLLKNSAFLGAFIFSCVYGILDEFHQRSVPGRTADFYDFLADAGGALLYVAIAWMRQSRNGDNESSSKS